MPPRKKTTTKLFETPQVAGNPTSRSHVVLVDDNKRMIGLALNVSFKWDGTFYALVEKCYILNPAKNQTKGIWDDTVKGMFWYRDSSGKFRVSKFKHEDEYTAQFSSTPENKPDDLPVDFLMFEE